jgi:hypothetical protein
MVTVMTGIDVYYIHDMVTVMTGIDVYVIHDMVTVMTEIDVYIIHNTFNTRDTEVVICIILEVLYTTVLLFV